MIHTNRVLFKRRDQVLSDSKSCAWSCGAFGKSAKQRQLEGNSRDEEVDVLCASAVKCGSSSVLNMACELCEDCS